MDSQSIGFLGVGFFAIITTITPNHTLVNGKGQNYPTHNYYHIIHNNVLTLQNRVVYDVFQLRETPNIKRGEHTMKFYTKEEITQATELFTDFYSDEDMVPYVNRTEDPDGNVTEFYLGLKDENGNAVTGFDMVYDERA